MGGLKKKGNGTYTANLKAGELGPYVVRATRTEYTEQAEGSSESNHASLGQAGAIAGIAGALGGKSVLAWTGAGIAAANPTYESSSAEKKGMVGIDIRLVDGKTNRIIKAFKATGTFKAGAARRGFSLFGFGTQKTEYAQSVLGQAVQMALNDAATQINGALLTRGGVATAKKKAKA